MWRTAARRRPGRRPLSGGGAAARRFDLVVIGGGSGGLAASREAARLGRSVAVLDHVSPSPHGSRWGLGGTCVNVGCIPKKLFHAAGAMGEAAGRAAAFGWKGAVSGTHCWETLTAAVNGHVRSLNWGYRVALRSEGVEYLNARGRLGARPGEVEAVFDGDRGVERLEAEHVLLAVGGRPRALDVPGGELAVSSDDLWTLERAPGRTLVVGGSYVALECAGALAALGAEATVMARSVFLRGMDRQMASLVAADLAEERGVRMLAPRQPVSIRRCGDSGRLLVRSRGAGGDDDAGEDDEEAYDTVLAAVGRAPSTAGLGLEAAGVATHPATGKVVGAGAGAAGPGGEEQTTAPRVYAVGDALHGGVELTPVAIEAGRLLARRLFAGAAGRASYEGVPTAVFTPLEYAFVGLSEEEAAARCGGDAATALEVLHAHFKPLEWVLEPGRDNACYVKVLARRCEERQDEQPVLGLHFLGPNAGEVIQGFAAAVRAGVTLGQLTSTVGIHPTAAEEVVRVETTKRSGDDPRRSGC